MVCRRIKAGFTGGFDTPLADVSRLCRVCRVSNFIVQWEYRRLITNHSSLSILWKGVRIIFKKTWIDPNLGNTLSLMTFSALKVKETTLFIAGVINVQVYVFTIR